MAINVVTSQGLAEYVNSGKTEEIPKEVKAEPAKAEKEPEKATEKVEAKTLEAEPEDPELSDDPDLSEKVRKALERARKAVNKKHREAREADELAESQYNERRLAEQRAERLESELTELKAKSVPKEAEDALEPAKEAFTNAKGEFDAEGYWNAKMEWKADQAVKKDRKLQAEERAAADIEQRKNEFWARAKDAEKDTPGLVETLTESDPVAYTGVLRYIFTAKMGPQVGYYLAKNPEFAQSLREMTPEEALAEVGVLAKQLSQRTENKADATLPPREVSRAPAPITPLQGTTATVLTDPSKATNYKDFKRAENARKAAQKSRH